MRKVLVLTITLLALSALAVAAAEPPAAQTALASPAGVACEPAAETPASPTPPTITGDLVPQPDLLTPCPTPQLLACWRSCGQQCVAMGCSSTGTSCSLEHGCGACSCFCV
jgi:hypothetical protein